MSQRTRARTTAGTTPSQSKKSAGKPADGTAPRPVKKRGESEVVSASQGAAHSDNGESLARTLRAVADELERDPELASRIRRSLAPADPPVSSHTLLADEPPQSAKSASATFRPRLVTGAGPELGTGVPDPHVLLAQHGERGFGALLEGLRLGTLRAIIREYHLDPGGKLARQNDASKLRKAILETIVG